MKILYLPNCYSQQRQREKKRKIYPVLMAMEAEWYRQRGHEINWNEPSKISPFCVVEDYDKIIYEPEGLPFLELPPPNRQFTRWWEYQDNGNFKYHPATYMQVANGCWWGKCTFCVEQKNKYEIRPVDSVIEEIKQIQKQGFREVFDDSGTFPIGGWLDEFLKKHNSDIRISCNMRLVDIDYDRLYKHNFRMLLFGLESANQKTLDKINKGTKVEDVKYIIKAAKAGLEPHIAVLFGIPGEDDKDALNTLRLVHWLLKKGYAKTAQASLYTVPNIKPNESQHKYVSKIYNVAYSPTFWLNKLRDIHDIDDLKYLWKQIKSGLRRGK